MIHNFPIIWIGIPIVLILMGTIDLGKAVLASDDKEIKAVPITFITRLTIVAMKNITAAYNTLLNNLPCAALISFFNGNY